MNEKIAKEFLDFLCKNYDLNYAFQNFEKYPFGNWCTEVYSYYNESGCFSVFNLIQRDEVEFVRLDDFKFLDSYILSSSTEKIKNQIRIFEYEPEIWQKHRKTGFMRIPFFWGSNKQVFRALAEVIQVQIDKHGNFFGIKVTEKN